MRRPTSIHPHDDDDGSPQLDLDLMVARGAAIFGAGKGGLKGFLYDGDDKDMLNISAVDVLPGRVLLADRGEEGQLRYSRVSRGVDGGR